MWRGVVQFGGAFVADATGVVVGRDRLPVHWIGDPVSGLGFRLQRLREESELAVRGQFWAVLQTWGLDAAEVRVLLSDGAR